MILHFLWAKVFKFETTSFHFFFPKDSENLKSLDIGLQEVGVKRRLNGMAWKKLVKHFFAAAILHRLWPKNSNLRPLFSHYFPPRILKIKKFAHWTLGSGGKKIVKQSGKAWRTNKQTHIWIFQLIERIGPEGQFFENIKYISSIHSVLHST